MTLRLHVSKEGKTTISYPEGALKVKQSLFKRVLRMAWKAIKFISSL